MLIRRVFAFAVLAVLFTGVLLDPCTFRLNNSNPSPPAPLWQMLLAFIDLALLVFVAIWSFEGKPLRALQVLGVETMYNLSLSLIYLGRFGLMRYAEDYGHKEYLMLYLFLIALRMLLMLVLSSMTSKPLDR